MQKGFSSIVIIILVLIALGGIGLIASKGIQNKTVDKTGEKQSPEQSFRIPEEYAIYQDYLKAIGGYTYTLPEEVEIDAEVVSVASSQVGAYPKVTGSVRINKFTIKENRANPEEGAGSAGGTNTGGDTTASNRGLGDQAQREYLPLKEGREVPALFLLTDQPVRVKYLPYGADAGGKASKTAPTENAEQVVSNTIEPQQDTPKPLVYENGILTFATKVGSYPKPVVKTLPGLKTGDRFTATVRYNGQLFIEEYLKL